MDWVGLGWVKNKLQVGWVDQIVVWVDWVTSLLILFHI